MKFGRAFAAAITCNDSLYIFGGAIIEKYTMLKVNEIIDKNGYSSEIPDLPMKLCSHAVALVNDTVSIITGGC